MEPGFLDWSYPKPGSGGLEVAQPVSPGPASVPEQPDPGGLACCHQKRHLRWATSKSFERAHRVAGWTAALIAVFCVGSVWAEQGQVSVRLMPVRYAGVDGDDDKFRAHHWMNDGYAGGIQELSASSVFQNGATLRGQGHIIAGQNDAGIFLALEKPEFGFARFDFSEFRKYYDGTGGMHHFFTTLQSAESPRELALDIGQVAFHSGLALPGLPALDFMYDRHYKDGVKSRLTWAAVKEGSRTRSIGPSWQEVAEATDTFGVGASHEIAGFKLSAKQEWEFMRAELMRQEQSLTTGTAASESKIRQQIQDPQSTLMTSTFNAQKEMLPGKLFYTGGYRFSHMDNQEMEAIVESNAQGIPTNFSNPKQIRNARADNDFDAHVWVSSLSASPWSWLTVIGRLKAEFIHRESNSTYPADSSPNSTNGSPLNGTIDERIVSLNENKAARFGEGLSLRVTALPKTALYSEIELEQAKVRMWEDRKDQLGPNANETFNRYTIADVDRFHTAVGANTAACPHWNITAQASLRRNNNDYDDQRESAPTGTARSAFFDGQQVDTKELSTRAALSTFKRLKPSVRYQLRDDNFATRAENEPIVKTGMISHIVTGDIAWQILEKLSATLSYCRQLAAVTTPARYFNGLANTPTFNADVDTWTGSADWALTQRLNLFCSLLYSRAENFNDFSDNGLPLGADFDQWDLTAGLSFHWTPESSLTARYGFYRYQPNSSAEFGEYDAHVIWLEAQKQF